VKLVLHSSEMQKTKNLVHISPVCSCLYLGIIRTSCSCLLWKAKNRTGLDFQTLALELELSLPSIDSQNNPVSKIHSTY
jgi:hypothetical protein